MSAFKKFIISALAATAVLAAPSAALAATAQPASPQSAPAVTAHVAATANVPALDFSREGCTTGSSSGNITTCIRVVSHSTGYRVRAIAKVHRSGRTISECLRAPFGIKCSGYYYIKPGGSLSVVVTGTGPAPNGTYCASTYRKNSSGTSTQIGHICLTKG